MIDAVSPEEAARAIEALLVGNIADVVRSVVRRELSHSPAGAAYIEDVAADVRLKLMRKLDRLRLSAGSSADESPIENLSAYASVAAENACHAFLRAQYPERTRFRNRVRYAIAHHSDTALVRDPAGVWRCRSKQLRSAPPAGATEALESQPSAWMAAQRIDIRAPLPAFVAAVLARCDRDIELDRLVDVLASVLGIVDVQAPVRRDEAAAVREIADQAPATSTVMEQREDLLAVWREIAELPPRQRSALLLNLRDADGGAALHLLPGTGVVAMAAIASALGIPETELAAMWDRLPLDDLSIAAALGITRQQVINLRKSARARLARRLRPGT